MQFIKSATSVNDFINDGKEQICFIGRSNVGKSSLINALANTNLAYVSSKPGRTQLVNYFWYEKFYLVDLPGYGYANVSKTKKDSLVFLVEEYLKHSKNLKAIFQICDAGVITQLDIEMSRYFNHLKIPHYVVLNKMDKQSNNYQNNLHKIIKALEINLEHLIMVSALKKDNIKKLNQKIYEAIKG